MFKKTINITTDYVTINQMLKLTGLIGQGAQAKTFLVQNIVKVNNVADNRRGRKLYPNDEVAINDDVIVLINKKEA